MIQRILKIAAVVLVGLALLVYFFYDTWMEKRLEDQLSEIINKQPGKLYQYSFDELDINVFDGSVDLEGITIKPTSTAFDSLRSEANGLRFLLDLSMVEIELDGFDVKKFLSTGIISVDSLIISEPVFEYYFHPRKQSASQLMPLQQVFNEKFQEANLGKLLIQNGTIKIDDQSEEGSAININHLNIELRGAHMDSLTLTRFSPFDYDGIDMTAAGIDIDVNEDFSIRSDTITFNIERESIELLNFQLNPKFSQEQFRNTYEYQKQWLAIKLDKLLINHINSDRFLRTGLIDIGKVDLYNASVALYKDKTKPMKEVKVKRLPTSLIHSINWKLNIDSVNLHNGFITVDQTSELTGKESHLFFSDLQAQLLNFTNDTEIMNESSLMYIDGNGSVLGKAAANIHIRFDLLSEKDEFEAWGTMGKVKGKEFNSILDPMAGLRIKSGDVHTLSFNLSGNDHQSTGIVDADYQGLKIEFIKMDSIKEKETKKGFISFAANSVINTTNRKTESSYLQGIIQSERDTQKGFFDFLWSSIQTGIVSTMAPFTSDKDTKALQKSIQKENKRQKKKQK